MKSDTPIGCKAFTLRDLLVIVSLLAGGIGCVTTASVIELRNDHEREMLHIGEIHELHLQNQQLLETQQGKNTKNLSYRTEYMNLNEDRWEALGKPTYRKLIKKASQ